MSDRKYGHRGYRDGDRERGRKDRKPRPKTHKEGPWGRGLGSPKASVVRCAACGGLIEGSIDLETTCPHCEKDLHTCTNCRHFDPSATFECRKEIPVRVPKKSTRNACDLFEYKVSKEFSTKPSAEEARRAFDALFDF